MLLPSHQPALPAPVSAGVRHATRFALLGDDQSMRTMVDLVMKKSGLTQCEIARRMGVKYQSVQQYRYNRRPTLRWLVRLADITGARVVVEFPDLHTNHSDGAS